MSVDSNLKIDNSTKEDDLKLAEMEAESELSSEILEKRKKGLLKNWIYYWDLCFCSD